jgi:lipopolysaccharide export system protein LptC
MSKGKVIFISISVAIMGAAVTSYFTQSSTKSKDARTDQDVKARLLGYELFRYRGDSLVSRVSGRKATLMEPSRLVCEDDIVGLRIRGGIREEASANQAVIIFLGESLFNQRDAALDTVELIDDVEFQRSSSRFVTERLLYSEKSGTAVTNKPVRMDSDGQFVAANGGMIYNLRDESLKLRGGVVGSVRSDIMESGLNGKKSK